MASPIAQSVDQPGLKVSILSIDGGGIRGVIAVKILQFLEQELQAIDGPDARLADYFDIIAGTSTGGLIAGMLTCPDDKGRPRFTANDGMTFYTVDGKSIFPPKLSVIKLMVSVVGPKYSPKSLEKILLKNLQDVRIRDTVTELLVPSFDIKTMQPVIFSTSQAKEDALQNAFLRDVLRGTSAAPTYFPPSFFQTTDAAGKSRDYNLVDGGLAMNNPAYTSVMHVLRQSSKQSSKQSPLKTTQDLKRLLVLSLGTGTTPESYNAKQASHWGTLSWVIRNGKVPILDMIQQGSADVVDMNMAVLFETLECPQNYLRIQALDLVGEVASIDDATKKNVENLINVGDKLLNTTVTSVDIHTGKYMPQVDRGTNKEALKRFANELVQNRKAQKTSNQN